MFERWFRLRQGKWLSPDVAREAMRREDTRPFEKGCDHYCLSDDYTRAVFVRRQAAWVVPDISPPEWHHGNYPPRNDGDHLYVMNAVKLSAPSQTGYWYKVVVPADMRITRIRRSSNETFQVTLDSDQHDYSIPFVKLDALMFELATGKSQSEDDIIRRFDQLIGR